MAELTEAGRVVVVGAGLAGAQCALMLRQGGWRGSITLVGEERHAPYDRPPLSKDVLLGKRDTTTLDIDWAEYGVELLTGRRATGLTPGTLHTDGGDLPYEALVIATGSVAVPLPGAEGGHVLRTVEDALALRPRLVAGARIALVGAGWIGAETATVARQLGCEVTVVEAAPVPLAGALPVELGLRLAEWYGEAGVSLRCGAAVAAVEPGALLLADGSRVPADEVVVGIGARPATGWLSGGPVGLDQRGAVLVDEHLRTDLPGVWAAGDCVSYPSARAGRRLTVQHWDHALQSGRAAAASVLGAPEPYDPVPYFWSEQFGRMVQYAGRHAEADQVVERGGEDDAAWSVLWLRAGRLIGLLAVDRPRDLNQGRKLIGSGAELDAALAADPAVQLKACVR
ncbi:oxidoreductase [Kitasatospora sp. MMS16-BH015]|uniref:NAD(P)/FAD-dependent oxidoreductase n=1 Tax=Kitasatospora sp. MMS16-BH015 TaxID=2018025 RepID=UPI000CA0EDF6|nr:FAD-dependent oxidoreductase [Kitasatospora sp. MMS16-BH015]AUG76765.1 oxidoreductase [Kitasatospora sp. MMS16-BH015]